MDGRTYAEVVALSWEHKVASRFEIQGKGPILETDAGRPMFGYVGSPRTLVQHTPPASKPVAIQHRQRPLDEDGAARHHCS